MNAELRLRIRMIRSSIFVLRVLHLYPLFFVSCTVFSPNMMWGACPSEKQGFQLLYPLKTSEIRDQIARRAGARPLSRSCAHESVLICWCAHERAAARICARSCTHPVVCAAPYRLARCCFIDAHSSASCSVLPWRCARYSAPGCVQMRAYFCPLFAACIFALLSLLAARLRRTFYPDLPILVCCWRSIWDGSLSSFSIRLAPFACIFPTSLH